MVVGLLIEGCAPKCDVSWLRKKPSTSSIYHQQKPYSYWTYKPILLTNWGPTLWLKDGRCEDCEGKTLAIWSGWGYKPTNITGWWWREHDFYFSISFSEGRKPVETTNQGKKHCHWLSKYNWLVVLTGTWILVSHSVGNVIIPIDELIFFRWVETTNQITTLWLCQNSYWTLPFVAELPIFHVDFP